jgi:hypothetical protein
VAGEGKRRSQRVFLVVPVAVVWRRSDGLRVREQGHTEVVNAHGALLRVDAKFPLNTDIELIHRKTHNSTRARVVAVYPPQKDGIARVAVELAEPSETFWGIRIPPIGS